jgi:ubiquinone/menaquinone biosynthesis C-methylase UbiE
MTEVWAAGDAYEPYVGRWSRAVAGELVAWLRAADDDARPGVPGGGAWLDVGCGTGALSQAVLEAADPALVVGVAPSGAAARLGSAASSSRPTRR